MAILGPDWEKDFGLNRNLVGVFYQCDYDGKAVQGSDEVRVAVVDGTVEGLPNWNSPFEGAGLHSKMPALTATLQSGTLMANYKAIMGDGEGKSEGLFSGLQAKTTDSLKQMQGRSDLTKINSTQVFIGAQPVRFNLTCFLKAFTVTEEVEGAIARLRAWSYPQKLAKDGGLANVIKTARGESPDASVNSVVAALFPSKAPALVSFKFGPRTFTPLVIESISEPLTAPMTQSGHFASIQFQMSLGSLTAWDAEDITEAYGRGPSEF